jgi:lysophospholipase L1-like esterase
MVIGQSDYEGDGGKISYSDDNGVVFTDLGQQYSQDSINCIIATTGSTYVQPGDLSVYETIVKHNEDTTLQRAWMNGLEARKVSLGDTINRTAGSYMTPTQVANLLATKVDTFDHVLEFDSAQFKGSSIFGNYLKNSNGTLRWGNYQVKTTNSVVQMHPLGISEHNASGGYGTTAYGVGMGTRVVSDIEVNRMRFDMYIFAPTCSVTLNIYVKSSAFVGGTYPGNGATLIFTKTYAAGEFNQSSSGLMTINFPTSIVLTGGSYVGAFIAESGGTGCTVVGRWTAQNSLSDRLNLFYCTAASNQFTSSWIKGSTGFYCPPILFEYVDGVTNSNFNDSIAAINTRINLKQNKIVIDPYMPDTIYTAVGRELNIYNDAFINLRPDYKLEFRASPNHGYSQNRGYRIMDTATGIWNTTLTANIYDEYLSLLETKSCIVKRVDTVPISGSSSKKILVLGNSLTGGSGTWITEVNRILKQNGDTLSFLGTRGTAPNKHYATGGWTFSTFTSSISSFHLGGITNVKAYVNDSCSSATLDYCIISLGINDVGAGGATEKTDAQITTIVNNADSLVKSVRHATYGFPNCKIIVVLSPIGNIDYDAYSTNYGALASPLIYEKNLRKLHKALSTKYLNTTNTWVCPAYYNIDRTYGYYYITTTKACARCTQTITTHTNGVHPTTTGYLQMADIIYSYLREALNSRK